MQEEMPKHARDIYGVCSTVPGAHADMPTQGDLVHQDLTLMQVRAPALYHSALRFLPERILRIHCMSSFLSSHLFFFSWQALISSQQTFTVSDPKLPDNPIVFASQGFLNLTGYKMEEVNDKKSLLKKC